MTFKAEIFAVDRFAVCIDRNSKRIVYLRVFGNTCKTRTFGDCQLRYIFSKIFERGSFDTRGTSAKSDIVKVCFKNISFRTVFFKRCGTEYFTNLSVPFNISIACNVFYKLLGDRGSTLTTPHVKNFVYKRCKSTFPVNAIVLIKTFIFNINERVLNVLWYLIDRNRNSVCISAYAL